MVQQKYKLIDSHIHLYGPNELKKLRWMTTDSPINYDHSYTTYERESIEDIAGSKFEFKGYVYIEVNFNTNLESGSEGLTPAIEEYQYVLQEAVKSQGDMLAIIPWAPLPKGKDEFIKYEKRLLENGDPKLNQLIKGYRYLLQDKPDGVMLQPKFIEALNYLGERKLVFDLGIDFHRRGELQYSEFEELLKQTENVVYIANHFGKPNLQDKPHPQQFENWSKSMGSIIKTSKSTTNTVYYKISGLFEECGDSTVELEDDELVERCSPYFKFIFTNVEEDKIIWASNWPVVKLAQGSTGFGRWLKITELIFDRLEIKEKTRASIYFDNILKAYNL